MYIIFRLILEVSPYVYIIELSFYLNLSLQKTRDKCPLNVDKVSGKFLWNRTHGHKEHDIILVAVSEVGELLNEIRQSYSRTIIFHDNMIKQSFSGTMFLLPFSKWRSKSENSKELVKVNLVSDIGDIPGPQIGQFDIIFLTI